MAISPSTRSRCNFVQLNTHRTLFVIRFTRNRIECALGDLIGIGFDKVERHEDLSWPDDLCNPEFQVLNSPPPRDDVHAIMWLQLQRVRIARIHFQPHIRRHALKDRNLPRLGSRVPMLDGAPGVEYEWELSIRLLGKWLPLDTEELGFAIISLELTVSIEARCRDFRSACWKG